MSGRLPGCSRHFSFPGSKSPIGLQTLCPRQLRLAFVECPEALGLELQGAGDVQAVECADSEFCAIAASQISAELEGMLRNRTFDPHSTTNVASELTVDAMRIRFGNSAIENLQRNGVGTLRVVEWGKPDRGIGLYQLQGARRMRVHRVQRNKETGVGVCRQ